MIFLSYFSQLSFFSPRLSLILKQLNANLALERFPNFPDGMESALHMCMKWSLARLCWKDWIDFVLPRWLLNTNPNIYNKNRKTLGLIHSVLWRVTKCVDVQNDSAGFQGLSLSISLLESNTHQCHGELLMMTKSWEMLCAVGEGKKWMFLRFLFDCNQNVPEEHEEIFSINCTAKIIIQQNASGSTWAQQFR